jgi:hypothetical protein
MNAVAPEAVKHRAEVHLMRTLILAVAFATLAAAQPRPTPAFDPVGKWTYSTLDDSGAAISGTMEIAGKPGAYTGSIAGGGDHPLPIKDVFTSPSGMVIFADLPDGTVAVIKVWQETDGKIQAGWGPLHNVIPATVARAK